ncbi:MAG: hypothetical protein NC099_02885 [Corallococcus sp.]|nr:hypothetical protein [Corallococcus sp.]
MNCKVIVNADSGNFARLDLDRLLNTLGCVNAELEMINSASDWSADGYETLVVCGGDGTLHNALEKYRDKKIVYVPCGTLNETAGTDSSIASLGRVNDEVFSYVCATGSFTEIGYSAQNKDKKRFKAIAYLPQILKNYRSCETAATLNIDGKILQGNFTLIMILKSHRCFGFPFNKSYKRHKGLYLVAIKSFGKDCLANRIKMFAPFFRVFFCGVNKPTARKNWMLVPFDNLTVTLEKPQNFCVDGEKRILCGDLHFCEQTLDKQIDVVKAPFLRLKRRRKFK